MSNPDHETNAEKLTEGNWKLLRKDYPTLFGLLAVGDLVNALDAADQRIAELEAENARLHALYFAERAAHNDRGGA